MRSPIRDDTETTDDVAFEMAFLDTGTGLPCECQSYEQRSFFEEIWTGCDEIDLRWNAMWNAAGPIGTFEAGEVGDVRPRSGCRHPHEGTYFDAAESSRGTPRSHVPFAR